MTLRPNPTVLRSLSSLTRSAAVPRRQLHITGPATYASNLLNESRASRNPSERSSDLSKRPQASSSGGNGEGDSQTSGGGAAPIRHFNSSRNLKAVGDSSTIDFAFLPDFDLDAAVEEPIRVPILPSTVLSDINARHIHTEVTEEVMKPLISLASADSTHIHAPSAMSEVHDNAAVDFEGMHSGTDESTNTGASAGEEQVLKQVWSGFLDDIFLVGDRRKAK